MPKQTPFFGAVCGRRKSGKTHLLIQMLRSKMFKNYQFNFIMFISPTLHLQTEVWKKIKGQGILLVQTMNERIIRKLIRYQAKQPSATRKHVLIICDDMGGKIRAASAKMTKEPALDLLAFSGRHYGISCIQLCQRWSQLSTGSRSQLDWVFWSGSANKREVTALHQEVGKGEIEVFRDQVRRTFTSPYIWMVFYNSGGIMTQVVL